MGIWGWDTPGSGGAGSERLRRSKVPGSLPCRRPAGCLTPSPASRRSRRPRWLSQSVALKLGEARAKRISSGWVSLQTQGSRCLRWSKMDQVRQAYLDVCSHLDKFCRGLREALGPKVLRGCMWPRLLPLGHGPRKEVGRLNEPQEQPGMRFKGTVPAKWARPHSLVRGRLGIPKWTEPFEALRPYQRLAAAGGAPGLGLASFECPGSVRFGV